MDAGLLELGELDVSLDDSPDCEEVTEGHEMEPCTHVVTHRIIACGDSILACDIAVATNRRETNKPTWVCRYCDTQCVRFIPV